MLQNTPLERCCHERVVAYANRRLDKKETWYCVTRKELLAVVHFARYFRPYLLGKVFKVRTEHSALSWLRRTPDPIGQKARWLEILEEFAFSIEHRPGVRHGNVDAMSRRFCKVRDCLCCSDKTDGADPSLRQQKINRSEVTVVVAKAAKRNVRELSSSEVVERKGDDREDTFIGGAADRECISLLDGGPVGDMVQSQDRHGDNAKSAANAGEEQEVFEWSWDGIQKAQQEDQAIKCVMDLLQGHQAKPAWKTVALESHDVKALWAQWPRLQIRDGLLKRRFESPDGLSVCWQIVWPSSLKTDFLRLAHGGMTGGHFGRRRSAASVQGRAYWPSWSTDLDLFLKQYEPCSR